MSEARIRYGWPHTTSPYEKVFARVYHKACADAEDYLPPWIDCEAEESFAAEIDNPFGVATKHPNCAGCGKAFAK